MVIITKTTITTSPIVTVAISLLFTNPPSTDIQVSTTRSGTVITIRFITTHITTDMATRLTLG
jgi:hypothetical protein